MLVEALEERGMSQAELARRMARPVKTISEIATGKAAITPETAIQLERALGISAGLWLGLESRFREGQARQRDQAELERHAGWLRRFPVHDLVGRGILERGAPAPQMAAQLLAFFGVSSPAGWDQHWGQIAATYRMSGSSHVSRYALAAWLRQAEREASATTLSDFRPDQLREVLSEVRSLSAGVVIAGAVHRARDLLYSAGVGLQLSEGIRGAPASGALWWIKDNPWIFLTLRYRTDDQLWFSLFHEIGHLLESGRRREIIEEIPEQSTAQDEQAADSFGRELLLPEAELRSWLDRGKLDRHAILAFAAEQRISPGIVVGRLQRDGVLRRNQFNDLKRPLPAAK
jgi:HTH-type transcriptional regulator/antitoxin HigA